MQLLCSSKLILDGVLKRGDIFRTTHERWVLILDGHYRVYVTSFSVSG